MPGKVAKIGTFSDWVGLFDDWRKDIGVNRDEIASFKFDTLYGAIETEEIQFGHFKGRRKWEKFLHANRLYHPQTQQTRLELFAKALEFINPNAAVTKAKSMLAVALAEQLLTLQRQIDKYRRRIQELFGNHPDHDLFGSLPGAGPKLAPRLLAAGAEAEGWQELIIDLAVKSNFEQFFIQPLRKYDQDMIERTMKYGRQVMTFSDSGAHVSQIFDFSIQTHLLAYWVRQHEAFPLEEAVRMLTYVPARACVSESLRVKARMKPGALPMHASLPIGKGNSHTIWR